MPNKHSQEKRDNRIMRDCYAKRKNKGLWQRAQKTTNILDDTLSLTDQQPVLAQQQEQDPRMPSQIRRTAILAYAWQDPHNKDKVFTRESEPIIIQAIKTALKMPADGGNPVIDHEYGEVLNRFWH